MTLDILTPEQSLFSGTAERVQLPGINGKFEVLDNHAPMIATIKEGKIKVTTGNNKQEIKVKSGIVEILKNKVSVLVEVSSEE